ncbi:MAG: cysteine desulfurase [Muribaculaceae bacterium]|nr:cysteine desulfurase [Muribaculaceae bacterium]
MLTESDIIRLREEFPILGREVSGRKMVYLDNTATSQTPSSVVDEIHRIYTTSKANVHRGVHTLSQEMTDLQEQSRERIRKYINAESREEVIFTRGTTEAINLVASSFGSRFHEGDEVILTVMEHHANIVPWQLLRDRCGIVLRVVDINDKGELDMEQYRSLFNERTVMASFCHVSNVLGTVNPVKEMISFAHSKGVPVLVDGAQASPHLLIDVMDLDCDFYVFSAHKMYGPTGIGVLYGKKRWLEEMPPYQGGGEMIAKVTFAHTTYAELPFKFEAGTPDFVGIAAFSKAIDFIERVGMDNIAAHEHALLEYTQEKMEKVPGLRIFGTAPDKSAVISFLVGRSHPYDLGLLLDKQGVEVRTGHHCAMPLMDRLDIPGTVRASFAVYNTFEEADMFLKALTRAAAILE